MMPLSWQIPGWDAYRDTALALHDVEREIASRQNSKHVVESKIVPSLIAKRDRLAGEVVPLKAAYEAAERAALERITPRAVDLQSDCTRSELWSAADGLDIPAFLRRKGV